MRSSLGLESESYWIQQTCYKVPTGEEAKLYQAVSGSVLHPQVAGSSYEAVLDVVMDTAAD